jgi:hypothetical protein
VYKPMREMHAFAADCTSIDGSARVHNGARRGSFKLYKRMQP